MWATVMIDRLIALVVIARGRAIELDVSGMAQVIVVLRERAATLEQKRKSESGHKRCRQNPHREDFMNQSRHSTVLTLAKNPTLLSDVMQITFDTTHPSWSEIEKEE